VHRGDHILRQAERRDDVGNGAAVLHGRGKPGACGQRVDEIARRGDDVHPFGAVVVIFRFCNRHLAELHSVPVPAITVIIRADFGPVAPAGFKLGQTA
jgi:hypothetical protein